MKEAELTESGHQILPLVIDHKTENTHADQDKQKRKFAENKENYTYPLQSGVQHLLEKAAGLFHSRSWVIESNSAMNVTNLRVSAVKQYQRGRVVNVKDYANFSSTLFISIVIWSLQRFPRLPSCWW